MTIAELADIAQSLGVVGLLAVAVVGGFRRWYVFSWQYVDMVADRDRWRDMALRGISAAEKATGVAEQTLRNGTPK